MPGVCFSIKDDLYVELIKIERRSEFIDTLLREYFEKTKMSKMSQEEIKAKIAELELKKEYEKRLEDLKNGN